MLPKQIPRMFAIVYLSNKAFLILLMKEQLACDVEGDRDVMFNCLRMWRQNVI